MDPEDIYVEGITKIAKRDIEVAKELGYVIKIVGIGQNLGDALQVRVHPVLLPQSHPLASVNDVYNAIFLHGDAVGDVMFYGRGAGSLPTGSAVVGDIIETARNIRRGATGRLGCTCYDQKPVLPIDQLETNYYVRLLAHDRPKVLASLASIFGDFDVSIESVVQRALPDGDAEIVWITHRCLEANFRSAWMSSAAWKSSPASRTGSAWRSRGGRVSELARYAASSDLLTDGTGRGCAARRWQTIAPSE